MSLGIILLQIGHKIDNSVYVQRPTLQNGFKVTGVRNGPITNGSLKGMATNNGSDGNTLFELSLVQYLN